MSLYCFFKKKERFLGHLLPKIDWHALCIKFGSWFDRNRNLKTERNNYDDLYEKK